MSAREYYAVQKLNARSVICEARQFLPANLWTKFDRNKPLNLSQTKQVTAAVNRALRSKATDFPFDTPTIKFKVTETKDRAILFVESVSVFKMYPTKTDLGTVYSIGDNKLDYDGNCGLLGFTRHAVERFLERCKHVDEYSYAHTFIVIKLLQQLCKNPKVEFNHGPMLSLYPFGYFPINWSKQGIWGCTSFLTPTMEGVPKIQEDLDVTTRILWDRVHGVG